MATRGMKPNAPPAPPVIDPRAELDRVRQVEWDHYYIEIARNVATRANCTGSSVGAVLVVNNRIISTGFNGTPEGFTNCDKGGCVRCRKRAESKLKEQEQKRSATKRRRAKQLDICICVHAEANAILSAARHGIRTEHATLYVTHKPCFMCLKEAIQVGVERVVYLEDWVHDEAVDLKRQYELLAEHLRHNDARNFEQLEPKRKLLAGTSTRSRKPTLDRLIKPPDESAEQTRKRQRTKVKRRRTAPAATTGRPPGTRPARSASPASRRSS